MMRKLSRIHIDKKGKSVCIVLFLYNYSSDFYFVGVFE